MRCRYVCKRGDFPALTCARSVRVSLGSVSSEGCMSGAMLFVILL